MWLKRIITGAVFFLIFLTSIKIWWLSWVLPIIIVIAGLAGIREFHHFARCKNINPPSWLSYLIALLIFADASWGNLNNTLVILCASICFVLAYFALTGSIVNSIVSAAVTIMSPLYIALPLGIVLFLLTPALRYHQSGLELAVFIVAVTWSGDTGAYFIGKNFGKHKLAPRLSPKKTIEGSIGGFFSAIIAVFILLLSWTALRSVISWRDAILLGIIIGFIAQIGDLAESAFKRDANLKDSGNTILGHGGILDVIDSLLLTIPASYLFFHFVSRII